MPYCDHRDRWISQDDCHALVLGAVSSAVLHLCRTACAYGQYLVSTVRKGAGATPLYVEQRPVFAEKQVSKTERARFSPPAPVRTEKAAPAKAVEKVSPAAKPAPVRTEKAAPAKEAEKVSPAAKPAPVRAEKAAPAKEAGKARPAAKPAPVRAEKAAPAKAVDKVGPAAKAAPVRAEKAAPAKEAGKARPAAKPAPVRAVDKARPAAKVAPVRTNRRPKASARPAPAPAAPAPVAPDTSFLPPLLAYVLPRYPDAKRQGLSFLTLLAGEYGFHGDRDALASACRAAGLTLAVKPRPALIIDKHARRLAGLEAV